MKVGLPEVVWGLGGHFKWAVCYGVTFKGSKTHLNLSSCMKPSPFLGLVSIFSFSEPSAFLGLVNIFSFSEPSPFLGLVNIFSFSEPSAFLGLVNLSQF